MAFVEIVSPGKGTWRESAKPGDKMRPGRPASVDMQEEYANDIAEYLSMGLYLESAAALTGVNTRTLHKWLRKGKTDYENEEDTGEARVYEIIQWGLAKFEELMHSKLDDAARRDAKAWGATAFRLERRLPERYGKIDTSKVEVSGSMGLGVATLPNKLSETLDTPEKIDAAKAIGGILSTLGTSGRPASVRNDSD